MKFKGIFKKIVDGLVCLLLTLVLSIVCFFVIGCPEAQQTMKPVVTEPADSPAEEPAEPTTIGDEKQEPETPDEPEEPAEPEPVETPEELEEPTEVPDETTAEPVETEPEEPTSTVTLPPGYELPAEWIPTTPPTLSADEKSAEASYKVAEWDPTAPNKQTEAGKPVDLISILPLKEREEVYDLFVASVDLPFFDEVAERMWEIQIRLFTLNAKGLTTSDWRPYDNYLSMVEEEQGLLNMPASILEDIYFQENPNEMQYSDGNSRFWMILEWYRLQLEHPEIDINVDLLKMENLYRKSCANGMIFGLDSPWY